MAHRIAAPASEGAPDLVITRGIVRVDGLELTMKVPTVSGISADVKVSATGGDPIILPDDLLAVLGRDWGHLDRGVGGWTCALGLHGRGPARLRDAESKLRRMAEHLATTLAEPPARYHARLRAERWRVAARRSLPLLGCLALIGMAARRGEALAALAERMPAVTAVPYPLDVTDRAALQAAGRDFVGRFGAPDVVVANAGINGPTMTGTPGDDASFERILRTNVVGVFDTFAPFVDAMRARGSGALVGIASVAGIRGMPSLGGYCASKAATIAYLESLRLELRASGVRVVTIAPGYIRTPMTARNPFPMPLWKRGMPLRFSMTST
jgi:NAD(P)-dependent dehydrogenase (short-subunit alcohol dehydrogenase family)